MNTEQQIDHSTPVNPEHSVLLVDDDTELTTLMSQFLAKNGFEVNVVNHGNNAIEAMTKLKPDLVVLDLMLPGVDGLTICRQIRPVFAGPIIMLTALDDDIDEVTGLEVGADDYLAKPVKPRVLLAHIRAQLRRQTQLTSEVMYSPIVVSDGQIEIDELKRNVTFNGETLVLSNAEYELLLVLAKGAGNIYSRDQLHQEIFKLEYDGLDRSIDIRISRLRKKFGDDPKEPKVIKTVRNKGYLIAN